MEKYNEELEKRILNRWHNKIRAQGYFNRIEIIIAFRMMIKDGYRSLNDLLETLSILACYNIYEIDRIDSHTKNIYMIGTKFYHVESPYKK